MEKITGIVLSASPWRMEDEQTGQKREGISLEYLMTSTLTPVTNDDGSQGYKHVKESISIQNYGQVKQVPGIYDLNYGFTIVKGKPVMRLQSIKFISEIK